ncbi:QsdR family transcriptional regulator [Kineosporia sp. NBRC 101731]|uniref:QsdR family transcriptional regulator n=1 Tax=Kineosporia sp. NBRC 101731 TaxID=3032199 RepID=UPI0025543D40|nr:QsdR family transcriptional regulator [Kineosporia sp. NBRC 101731]
MSTSRSVMAPEVILRGAAVHFQRHSTLDMDLLARELAISRATLYRAVGSRDRLLGMVFGTISRWIFQLARDEVRPVCGPDGVLAVTRAYVKLLDQAVQLRTFMQEDPQIAARVLFTPAGDVMRRSVQEQTATFREAGIGGDDLEDRAFLYVRLVESVLFSELLGTGQVSLAGAEGALRALLRE